MSKVNFWESEAVNAKVRCIETRVLKIAYNLTGNGLSIIVNRFRGTLDTWDTSFLDGLGVANKVPKNTYLHWA